MLCIALLAGCPAQNEGGIIGNGITNDPTSQRPVARDPGTIRTFEDVPVELTLTGRFVSVKGPGELYVYLTRYPTHGTVTPLEGFAPLDVVYTPDPEYSGEDEFDFVVVDEDANVSNDITVDIEIENVNDAPVGSAAPTTTAFDTPVAITLNATDPDSVTLYIEVVGGAGHGTLNQYAGLAPLTVIYTPSPGYYGADSFSFIVHDAQEATSLPATAMIDVTSPAFPLKLAFLSPPQTVQAYSCSAVNQIQTRDDNNAPIKMPAHLTVEFDGPGTATFYSDAACTIPLSFLVIAQGTSTASFYFLDTAAGNPEYTVSDAAAVILPASQSHVITTPPVAPSSKSSSKPAPVITVHKSARHECILYQGALYCRGANDYGQLGDGTMQDRSEAIRVGTASDWTEVHLGANNTCGFRDLTRYCWGLGYGPRPVQVP